MKKRVNLYLPQYQPKLRLLTLSIALMFWLFIAACCGLAFSYLTYEQQQFKQEIAQLEKQKQQQNLLFSEIQIALNNRTVDAKLLNQVASLQKNVTYKNKVLSEIAGQEKLKSNGFSGLMIDLARHHHAGLWLTHINLNGLNVKLKGAANKSAIIPKWLGSLGQTDYFKGQEFADTRMYRENGQLHFIIKSGIEPAVANGAAP